MSRYYSVLVITVVVINGLHCKENQLEPHPVQQKAIMSLVKPPPTITVVQPGPQIFVQPPRPAPIIIQPLPPKPPPDLDYPQYDPEPKPFVFTAQEITIRRCCAAGGNCAAFFSYVTIPRCNDSSDHHDIFSSISRADNCC